MPVHCAVWSRRGVDNTKPKNAPGRTLDAKVRIVRHALALQMPHGTSLECVAYAANQLRNISGRLSDGVMHIREFEAIFTHTRGNFLPRECDTFAREFDQLRSEGRQAGRARDEKSITGNRERFVKRNRNWKSYEESGIPVTELLEESARN